MFKVNYINGDYLNTLDTAKGLLGQSLHKGLQTYFGGNPDIPVSTDETEAIKTGYDAGHAYLSSYSDVGIKFNKTSIQSRSDLEEKFAFAYYGYVKDFNLAKNIKELYCADKMLKHKIEVDNKVLPIPLKGYPDLVFKNTKDKVEIWDHKFVTSYASEDNLLDGSKMIQAAFYYFLVSAEYGETPYRMVFREYKITKNKDGSPQFRDIPIVFKDHHTIFELFYRYYFDVTDALLGKQVYVPNVNAMYDKDISIMAYIYRLDETQDREEAFKAEKVNNITDFLRKKIEKDGVMKKYIETVTKDFVSSKSLNYNDMTIEEKIKYKLSEHGIALNFDSKVDGSAVTLYRYEPSIGIKMSKIETYVKDIEQVVGKSGIRILAPIPNTSLIGFEIPRDEREFPKISKPEGFILDIGKTIYNTRKMFDIREAPHMLVAGSTGSGKSVFLNSIIKQLLKIDTVELHVFDPKQVELADYEGVKKVVEYQSDPFKIEESLEKLVNEMEIRYTAFKKLKIKSIKETADFKYKFIFIDEFADLKLKSQINNSIQLLAQKGRAAGIHIIIASQRVSTKIISGDIKVNFPTKAVFRMAKEVDSRVMLDMTGAEKLLGKGDMLFSSDAGVERLQGYNV